MEGLKISHKKVQIEGLKNTYTFLHITDLHLVCISEDETMARIEHAKARKESFRVNGITSDMWLEKLMKYANDRKVDAVLLTGDILDFPSPEAIMTLKQALETLEMPYVYIIGNHDWSYLDDYHTEASIKRDRPLLRTLSAGNEEFHTVKVGEVTFVAVDNSTDAYSREMISWLEETLAREENVILLQHIPLYCDTLHEDSAAFWGEDLTLGKGAVAPDDSADLVKDILLGEPAVKAVICGHLHFEHKDLVGGILPQYITALSAHGNATLFEVGNVI